MGYALGVLRIRYDDLVRLTPEELLACFEAYTAERDMHTRDAWQRMRLHAAITVQPHIGKKITPEELFPLPWDETEDEAAPVRLTAEERAAELERVKRLIRDRNEQAEKSHLSENK